MASRAEKTNSRTFNVQLAAFVEESARRSITLDEKSGYDDSDEYLDDERLQLASTFANDIERAKQVEASWNRMQEDIEDLQESMKTLASVVHTQQEDINVIEQNLTTANENVEVAEKTLSNALKYTTAVYPIAGATIGGCIAGPLGFMVGLKFGAIATAVGGVIGFHGARILKRNQTAHLNSTDDGSSNEVIAIQTSQ